MNAIHDPVGIFALLLAGMLFSAWLSDVLRFNIAAILLIFGIIAGPEVPASSTAAQCFRYSVHRHRVYPFLCGAVDEDFGPDAGAQCLQENPFGQKTPPIPRLDCPAGPGRNAPGTCGRKIGRAGSGHRDSLRLCGNGFFPGRKSYEIFESGTLRGSRSVSILVAFVLLVLDAVAAGADARRAVSILAFGCMLAGLVWSLFPRLASIFLAASKASALLRLVFLLSCIRRLVSASFLSLPNWFTAYIVGVALSPVATPAVGTGTGRILLRDDIFRPCGVFSHGYLDTHFRFLPNAQWLVWAGVFMGGGLAARVLVAFFSKRISPAKGPMLGLAIPFTTFSLAVSWILYGSGLIDTPLFLGTIALALITGIIPQSPEKYSFAAKVLSPISERRPLSSPTEF
jgi:Kef-type K+ transport system membrane component KefB